MQYTLAQSSRQRDLMVLFVDQDPTNLFARGRFSRVLALADTLAKAANRLLLILEIELQHLSCRFRRSEGLGNYRRNAATNVNPLCDNQGTS